MKIKVSFSFKNLTDFIKKYCHRLTYLILIIYFLYTLFFLYQYFYLALAEKKAIDPSLMARKKEAVNQELFEKVKNRLEEKTNLKSNININIDNPF